MKETNQIIPFQYESQNVRIIKDEEGNPWWVAKDVCDILNIQQATRAVENLDEDEVSKTHTLYTNGGPQTVITISESGLYALIIRSNKPEAKKFRKWITSEVLPSIRKTGTYTEPGRARAKTDPLLELVRQQEKAVRFLAARIKAHKLFDGKLRQALLHAVDDTLEATGVDYSVCMLHCPGGGRNAKDTALGIDPARFLDDLLAVKFVGRTVLDLLNGVNNPDGGPEMNILQDHGFRPSEHSLFVRPGHAIRYIAEHYPGLGQREAAEVLIRLPGAYRTVKRLAGVPAQGVEFPFSLTGREVTA